MTQTELAGLAGMDQQALAALEKRDSKSSSFTPALARALGTSVADLLGEAEAPRIAAVPDASALINPDELSELVSLYCAATQYGRSQLLRSARNVEKRKESASAGLAAND